MNEQEYMKVTSKIDENYINEYKIVTAKHNISVRKKIRTSILVAAAVALMIPATIYASTKLTHRDKVGIYYSEEGAQMIEKSLQDSGFTVENGKIRLTVDVMMCDGNYVTGVYTLTALTEDAKKHLDTQTNLRYYADTGEWIWGGGGFQSSDGSSRTENEVSWSFRYPVANSVVDRSRPTRIEFFEDFEGDEPFKYDGFRITGDYTYYEGIYFDLISEPNIPTRILRSQEGKELTLSAFGISMLDEDRDPFKEEINEGTTLESLVIITTDGNRTDIMADLGISGIFTNGGGSIVAAQGTTLEITGDVGRENFSLRFGNAMNIDNISGVEINGVAYMAE
ncbi:MAG: DUF4179 domain-containing protein [Clostridiales bacterium]|nr:DUF4179 domain-containing protein [Clostridiales bacterium]